MTAERSRTHSRTIQHGHRRVVVVLAALVAVAAAFVHAAWVQPLAALDAGATVPWWALALAFVAAEVAVVHVHGRTGAQTFSLSEVPLVVGLFYLPPVLLVVARLTGALVALTAHRRQRGVKLTFNVALIWLETGLAVALFRILGAPAATDTAEAALAAFGATVGAGLVGTLIVFAARSLDDRMWDTALWWRIALAAAVAFAANTSLGLIAVTLLRTEPMALGYLLFVVAVVYLAYRSYSTVHRRQADLELLYDFPRTIGGELTLESVSRHLLVRARGLLRAAHAEVVVENVDPDGAGVRLLLDRDGQLTQLPDAEALREARAAAMVIGAAALPRATRHPPQRAFLDHAQLKDAVIVRVPLEADITAAVVVGNRHGDASSFSTEDVRLLQTLANHAGVALANGRLVDRLTLQAAEREHQALHDALTGLPNRTLFQRELASLIARPGMKAAVLLMDLNGFKDVNDTLGHHAGDQLLCDIGGRLQRTLDGSGLVARLGGDEFAVLLPGVGGEVAAKTVAREVLSALEETMTIHGVRVDIGASIGISLCPLHADEAHALLRHADVAMYSAKASHTPIGVYNAERDHHSPERLALVGELRVTLEQEKLTVAYQPKADLRTGNVVGVEALARWNHAEHGFVPPDEFVGVAERSGLIHSLTRHVLRTALTQCRTWRLAGLPLNVSVNLSARSLVPELPQEVGHILAETGVAANALTLEITESSIMADPAHTGLVLEELSSMGVSLAIDDFGTGYSSLTYLKRLPVDEIKIDKSFVFGMARDEDDAAIVRSTVDLGRNLGLRVVAEGIEDEATWRALTTLGCDMAQGYYLSPPLTPVEFDAWLRARISNQDAARSAQTRPVRLLPPLDPSRPEPGSFGN